MREWKDVCDKVLKTIENKIVDMKYEQGKERRKNADLKQRQEQAEKKASGVGQQRSAAYSKADGGATHGGSEGDVAILEESGSGGVGGTKRRR